MPNAAIAETGYNPLDDGWVLDKEPGFAGHIGPIWVKRVDGILRHGLIIEPQHVNRSGNLHGGMVMAFFDHAIGLVGYEAAGGGRQVTVQMNTHFIGSATVGMFIEMQGEVIRQTNSFLFLRGQCFVGETLIASADGIWKKLRPRQP